MPEFTTMSYSAHVTTSIENKKKVSLFLPNIGSKLDIYAPRPINKGTKSALSHM